MGDVQEGIHCELSCWVHFSGSLVNGRQGSPGNHSSVLYYYVQSVSTYLHTIRIIDIVQYIPYILLCTVVYYCMLYCKYCMYQSRSPHLRCPLQQTHPFSFTTFVLLTVLCHLFFPFFTLDIPTILSSDTFDNLRHFPTIDFGNYLIPIDLGSLLLLFTSQPSASRSVIAHELLRPSSPNYLHKTSALRRSCLFNSSFFLRATNLSHLALSLSSTYRGSRE